MRKFLLTLPNGNEKCILAKNSKTFLRNFLFPLPTGGQISVWPKAFESFFLHFPPDMGSAFGP
ncbi:hypothetical protein EGQ24_00870 [bacterium]|nr:hypothetical protein [bacterium]